MSKTSLIASALLLLVSINPARAGLLNPDLENHIAGMDDNETVSVWIRMADNHNARAFKAATAASSPLRAERYRSALTELKQTSQMQADILTQLNNMEKSGEAGNVKSHWIINLIEADLAVGQLKDLAARSDVREILLASQPELIAPPVTGTNNPKDHTGTAALPGNLTHIKADICWDAGFDGTGRVICSFDSGVKGDHPALIDSWKGNDGDSAAAWFDPVDGASFPHTFPLTGVAFWHGTHTTGILVGHDDMNGDTVGVAPGAKWIAAGVIDVAGASIFDAFEWAVDPDGDPNTMSDVPDVINHSWGYRQKSCANIIYDVVDNVEALGIVNIFAAGNEQGSEPLRNPADRAQDSLDCFAVGALGVLSPIPAIWFLSTHGPSPCTGGIKPNVVAPGQGIESSMPNGDYDFQDGTSMATPHVSGLVAILRQFNPNATVDEIKTAIIEGAETAAGWGSIPNNTYGWGQINCIASLLALPTAGGSPSVQLFDFVNGGVVPGDTVTGTVVLKNLGDSVGNVTAVVSSGNPALTIVDGNLTFGDMDTGDTLSSIQTVRAVVADSVLEGSMLIADLVIAGDSYIEAANLFFLVDPPGAKTFATHSEGRTGFTVSNFGGFGFGTTNPSFFPHGVGFTFDGGSNDLFEAAIVAATSPTQVSTAVHEYIYQPDMDFAVAPGGNLQFSAPGPDADQQTYSKFNDSRAKNPIGLEITQETYAYSSPNDDFIIIRHILKNISGGQINNLLWGLHFNWDIVTWNRNAGGYDAVGDLLWVAYNNSGSLSDYRGMMIIEGDLYTAGATAAFSPPGPFAIYPSPDGNGFDDITRYNILNSQMTYASTNQTSSTDLYATLAAGPITLAQDAYDTVTFAVLAGETLTDLRDAALRATEVATPTEPDPDISLPVSLSVYQNYPNPFNPATTIRFDLPHRADYRVEVINMLGQTVYETSGSAPAGRVSVIWQADDFASGAYLYRVTSGEQSITRKMMLLK